MNSTITTVVLPWVLVALSIWLYTKKSKKLKLTLTGIANLKELESASHSKSQELETLNQSFTELTNQIQESEQGKAQLEENLQQLGVDKTKQETDLNSVQQELVGLRRNLVTSKDELQSNLAQLEELKANNQSLLGYIEREETLLDEIKEKETELSVQESNLIETKELFKVAQSDKKQLQAEISLYSRVKEYIDLGWYEEPKYLFNTSDRFKAEIKSIRGKQKELIKDKGAITLPSEAFLEDAPPINKALLEKQAKLMLKAFNIESDSLIEKVKPSNYATTLEKLEKLADDIEQLSSTLLCGFSQPYIELKFKEYELQYQFTLKKQEEDEIAQIQRETLREEEKLRKEYELATRKAEKEASAYEQMIEKAKAKLDNASEAERRELEIKVQMLEEKLSEANQQKQRAMSMAEQTKAGYVYVISNIGVFGEGVHKIGMSRRVEPLDRIKELSNASVPFPYEAHMLVYSKDAPALETKLHQAFKQQKINVVNQRKEFFLASLVDIQEQIGLLKSEDDQITEYYSEPQAEEYYESRKLNGLISHCYSNIAENLQ